MASSVCSYPDLKVLHETSHESYLHTPLFWKLPEQQVHFRDHRRYGRCNVISLEKYLGQAGKILMAGIRGIYKWMSLRIGLEVDQPLDGSALLLRELGSHLRSSWLSSVVNIFSPEFIHSPFLYPNPAFRCQNIIQISNSKFWEYMCNMFLNLFS